MTSDTATSATATSDRVAAWAASAVDAAGDDAARPLVEAALRCMARWGIRKTSLDDIAREAGVSRATVYREFPGGKDRVVAALVQHRAGRLFHDWNAELEAAASLEDVLVVGVGAVLRLPHDDELVRVVVAHEPELVLPHFAFDRLDRVFDMADALARPHLARFLAAADIRPAAELLTRTVLTFALRPAPWLDPHDPASVRHLVRTYLVPAISSAASTSQEHR